MKNVGILSMQRIANYGSFLQAYGLKQMLEDLGCDVQFVDYHPGETLIKGDGGTGIKRKIAKVIEVLKYDASIRDKVKFIRYKRNYAKNNFKYLGLREENYRPKLDVLVIGSDEVFNCVQNNTNVGFSPELFGVGNNAEKVITYAASFGNTTIEKLKKYGIEDKVANWLNDIASISVRDNNSGDIVQLLTGKKPCYNLDPVLMYDFLGNNMKIPRDVPEDKYMILYGYAGRFSKEECIQIRKYADLKHLKILCIGGIQNVCDKFIDCNPFQVIAYFQNADCVVTDTFHGTILSVITHRQFAAVVRDSGYGNREKMKDLLARLELSHREIKNIDLIQQKLDERIDYEKVDKIINIERKKTIQYLKCEILNG